ncbi:tripartite tricarboxylate transporter substrate binding protein [Pigmentiphaga soli]|uniref:Tripartite tricarboxylate transporter substrate binding protein n=1 Tax=Pigmentiphaga soli TaxID=1007095 RepID=A0ABP8GT62_9BURK
MLGIARYLAPVCLAMSAVAPCAMAQDFPNRPIRFVVPYQTGGLPDVMARLVAQKVEASTGQPVVVDNRSGASGILAAEYVAKSAPDGYTLFVADIGHFAINPALYHNLSYDPNRDFTPVTTAVHGPLLLVANSGLEANSVPELIALARAHPGKVNYGSPGNGSVHQLAMARLSLQANVKMVHIPYRSTAQAIPALVANDVQVMFVSPPSVNEFVKSGRLKVLGVGSPEPTPLAPGAPAVAASGFPGFNAVTTVGFLAPAGTPAAVVGRLNEEIGRALKAPDVMAKMPGMGVTVVADSPQEFRKLMLADQAYYRTLVEQTGVKVD